MSIGLLVGCGGHDAPRPSPLANTAPAAPDLPSADECRDALANMLALIGTEREPDKGDVRACAEGSTARSVACARQAHSLEELTHCGFMHRSE